MLNTHPTCKIMEDLQPTSSWDQFEITRRLFSLKIRCIQCVTEKRKDKTCTTLYTLIYVNISEGQRSFLIFQSLQKHLGTGGSVTSYVTTASFLCLHCWWRSLPYFTSSVCRLLDSGSPRQELLTAFFLTQTHTRSSHQFAHQIPPTAGNLYMLHASTGASIYNLASSCSSFHCYSCWVYQRTFKRL